MYNQEVYTAYCTALMDEIQHYLNQSSIPCIQSLYFGGGTPSMVPELIQDILHLFKNYLKHDAEIGIEIHPLDAYASNLRQLADSGINRVSLGIETFNPILLKRVGRTYTPEQAIRAIQEARKIGFLCVDVNLIYGIPGQSIQDSIDDTKKCIALGVDHISAYPLISFKHTPLGKRVERNCFPHYGYRARLLAQREIAKICLSNGFQRTSVWSFTRHAQPGYSTVTREQYRGFGAGSGSKIDGLFWFNTFSIAEYVNLKTPCPAISMHQSERFRRFHWLYWQIYRMEIDEQAYSHLFQRKLSQDFGIIIKLMQWVKWVKKTSNGWRMTERGAIWAHQLQMLFSLSYIDEVWSICQKEPWPEVIILN